MQPILATATNEEIKAAAAGGVIGATYMALTIFLIAFYIISIIATWKIFKKAGQPGWKCLIPIYNIYVMYKIVGMSGWFWCMFIVDILLYVIMTIDHTTYLFYQDIDPATFDAANHAPTVVSLCIAAIVTIICDVIYSWRTSKVFGHGVGYFIGLLLLQPIFWLILGFGKSKYNKKVLKGF